MSKSKHDNDILRISLTTLFVKSAYNLYIVRSQSVIFEPCPVQHVVALNPG